MMTQTHRGKGAWLRLAATIPAIAATFFAFGCGTKNHGKAATDAGLAQKTPDSSVFYIHVSEVNGDYSILCNGEVTEIDKIGEAIAEFYAGEEMYYATVSISADNSVKMGVITDIKEQLRNARTLKVRFETNESAAVRHLPPVQSDPVFSDDINSKMNRRDIIVIKVNRTGCLLLGGNYVNGSLHNEDLYRQEIDKLKRYISNPENGDDCPSFEMRDILMPDGSEKQFRVSNAMISFQCDNETSYDDYTKAMRLITTAYNELRDELSSEVFGKSLAELSDAEMQVIYQAIPICVSELQPRTEHK